MNYTKINEELLKRPLIISGPCSAETEEQVINTAIELAKIGKINIFRAGIWKPRTRPGVFEGVGTKGLPWLQEVKKITNMPITVEVANTKQIEDALWFEVDLLWIGTRSTVNPTSMNEIAFALQGTKIPVFVKNPINPDLQLWIGAIERLTNKSVNVAGLIHRGFSTFGNTEFRNSPMWHIGIEMKRRYPELIMLCDASHICGKRDTIQSTAQKSIDLDYDGLMIESHINPDTALSDSKQQLTPKQLDDILKNLIWRKEKSNKSDFNSALENLRENIDQIDDEILQLLSQRMKISDKIGQFKKENNITILQPARWNEILEKGFSKGDLLGLSDEFIAKYLSAIHMESINHQNKIMNS